MRIVLNLQHSSMKHLRGNKSLLPLFSLLFLFGAFLEFGFEFCLTGPEKALQSDFHLVKVTQSHYPTTDLFNLQLSECEDEAASKYSLQQHAFSYVAYDLCFNAFLVGTDIASTKIRGPVLPSASELIIRQHRLVI